MIIIDVEIEKAILGRNETPIEGIEYCQGWCDFVGMGISCVCTYDTVSHLTRVFLEEDLQELAAYLQGKRTAGFNTKRFDLPLLAWHGVELSPEVVSTAGEHYDILEEIWIALGLNPDKFNPRTHGGWGLDAVCQATLGIAKTGNGALAPVWWQQGKRGKVIDYCCNDVWMEGSLLLHIIKCGGLVSNGKESVRVKQPPTFDPHSGGMGLNVIGRQYGAVQAKAFMDVNNIVGGPNEAELAKERRAAREKAEKRAAGILNSQSGESATRAALDRAMEGDFKGSTGTGGLGIMR